jgi:hypothetical protein
MDLVEPGTGYVREGEFLAARSVNMVIAPLAVEVETLHLLVLELPAERGFCQF